MGGGREVGDATDVLAEACPTIRLWESYEPIGICTVERSHAGAVDVNLRSATLAANLLKYSDTHSTLSG